MQFMIDADRDPTPQLRAVAVLLVEAADARDATERPEGFRTDEEILAGDPAKIFAKTSDAPGINDDPAAATREAHLRVLANLAAPPAAVAPPPAVAPAPPPAAAPVNELTPVGERDSKGELYDPLVHSSSHAKVADGSWKKRRNSGTKAAAPAPAADPPRQPSSASVAGADTVGPAVAAPPPAAPAPAAIVAPPPAEVVGPTFRSVVAKANAAISTGKLTAEAVLKLVKDSGAPDLQTLNAMAHLVPQVDALIDAALFGK